MLLSRVCFTLYYTVRNGIAYVFSINYASRMFHKREHSFTFVDSLQNNTRIRECENNEKKKYLSNLS